MNLHQIVSGAIAAINPFTTALVEFSLGSGQGADGTRVPLYTAPMPATVQMQPISGDDLKQMDGINLEGTHRAIYLTGEWSGLVRVDRKGGDKITLADSSIWLVTQVLEHWPDWTKVAVTLQDDTTPKGPHVIISGGTPFTVFDDALSPGGPIG